MNGDKSWSTNVLAVKDCGWCKDKKQVTVYLPPEIHAQIKALSEAMGDMEWLGYLCGRQVEGGYEITSLAIPEQQVSYAAVKVTKPLAEGVIGTVHSHHYMGAFLSSTDEDYVGSNHPVTLVFSHREGYKVKVKFTLPCGSQILDDADLIFVIPNFTEVEKFVEEAKKKMTEETYTYQTPYQAIYNKPAVIVDKLVKCNKCHKELGEEEKIWAGMNVFCRDCYRTVFGEPDYGYGY